MDVGMMQWSKTQMGRWGRSSLRGFLLVGLLLAAACAPVAPLAPAAGTASSGDAAGAAGELVPVALGVGFIPSVQFASFYVAIDQGYFAEEGLDVSLEYGFENDYLKLVGLGERQFMIGSGDQVILGQAQGLPVRYVMNWFTRYPVVVFSKASAGIAAPEDLAGKRIGLPGPFGANYVALRGILEAAGLTEADVDLQSIGFTQAAAIDQDSVDAAVDYAANGPVVLRYAGAEIVEIGLDEYVPMPSNGVVTNATTLETEPELVRKFVRASLRGVAYTLANPDEAFAIALKFVPEAGGDNAPINRAIFDTTLAFWATPAGAQAGATELTAWEAAVEFMVRVGLIEGPVDAAALFTNEFLP
jgi:NitT/TauT family transport system substrate-binding protein